MKKKSKVMVALMAMIMAMSIFIMPSEANAASYSKASVKNFKVSSKTYNSVSLSWSKKSGTTRYQVYRSNKKSSGYKRVATVSSTKYTNKKLATGKTYYYKVRAYKKSGKKYTYTNYTSPVKAYTSLSTPSAKVAVSEKGVNVSWSSVSGATGYQVYRADADAGSSYKRVKTTTERSFVDTSAEAGKTYSYKVRAYRKSGSSYAYSSYSSAKKATRSLDTPVIEVTAKADGIDVVWDKVPSATGYEVYRATENGEFEKVKVTTEKKFLDASAEDGMAYQYKVRAYRTIGKTYRYSSYSEVKGDAKTLKSPVIEVAAKADGIEVVWNEVSFATGYEVYRATENGEFEKVETTTEKKFLDASAEDGMIYQYKARAYRKIGEAYRYSSYSDVKSDAKALKSPVIEVTASADSIEVVWDEVPFATGYEVYRATENSEFEKLDDVTETSYTDENDLEKAKTYQYKVRAYRTLDDGYSYSEYSSIESGEIDLDAPVITAETVKNSVIISWDEVLFADGYEIYLSDSEDGVFEKIADVTDATYTVDSIQMNKEYYFKVKAYRSDGTVNKYSDLSDAIRAYMTLEAPTVEISVSGNEVTLAWDEADGATCYDVKRADAIDGPYAVIDTVETNSFTDGSPLELNKKYYYKVSAKITEKDQVIAEAESEIVSASISMEAPVITIGETDGDICIQWNEVDGANIYEVSRADSKDGEYEILATPKENSYVDQTATGYGHPYYYKVRAGIDYGDVARFATDSNIVSHERSFETPVITKIEPTGIDSFLGTTFTIEWNEVSGATNYQVYRSETKDGVYRFVGATEESTYDVTDFFDVDEEYYFKVVAQRTEGDEVLCEATSEAVCGTMTLEVPEITDVKVKGKKVIVTWTPVANATSYEVTRATEEDGEYEELTLARPSTYEDYDIEKGTTYYYRIRACIEYDNGEDISSETFGQYSSVRPITVE